MSLTLSENVIIGLKNLGTHLSIDVSKKLIANSVKLALHLDANIPSNPEIYALKPDRAKQSEYAVITVLFLATKYSYDNQKLRSLLEKHEISTVIADEMIKIYDINRKDFIMKNLKIGHSLPHISDVEWKLICDVKSSSSEQSSGELSYRVNLGQYNEKTGERENIVEFICNVEELQSLINRLKEISQHCAKVSGVKSV